jgi:Flp pilus assembly protein TadG
MVTAEFAVALPAFVVVLLAAMFAVSAVLAQIRCEDAAATAARLAARGDPVTATRAASLSDAPTDAQLVIATSPDYVTATVRAVVSPLGFLRFLPAVTVQARVVQAREGAAEGLG